MQKLRHTLALSALSLFACVGDSTRESARDSSDRAALVRGASRANGGSAAGSVEDGGAHLEAAEGAKDAGTDSQSKPWATAEDSDDAGVNAIEWNTRYVKLRADDFRITAAGKGFLSQTAVVDLHSDPGDDEYKTFEATWTENGVEMRLLMYFHADGTDWWVDEIRVYNGRRDADWLIAKGEWFRRPLGQPFTGDLDLTLDQPCCSAVSDSLERGHLTLHGLELRAFLTPEACIQSRGYVIDVLFPIIEMTTAPNRGFGAAVYLRDQSCKIVEEGSGFSFAWTVDHPSLVDLSSPIRPTNAQLQGLAAGKTILRALAKDRDGAVVAEGTMMVIVTAASNTDIQ